MNAVAEIARDAAPGVVAGDTSDALSAIRGPDCAAAIWKRQPMPGFQTWIDTLGPTQLPRGRIIVRPEAVPDAVQEICTASGTPEGAQRDRLADDIAALADIFAGLMDAKWLRLRLDVITTNACRRFHIDAVTARLVCTYRGTGTQYGISKGGAEPGRIFTVPTGSPILLRGTLWRERPRSGLLHRSPPIEGTGETRAVLVFDSVDDSKESA